jgi:predicted nucleotidyltransferase
MPARDLPFMLELIEGHRDQIAELCRRFGVQRLDVFGSAARGTDFDPEHSDVDLLVSYRPDRPRSGLTEYFELREALTELLGRPVDLVMAGAVENPFVRAGIERSRQMLYGS